jgi:hypothetical protein
MWQKAKLSDQRKRNRRKDLMKIKDITERSERWATPLGTLEEEAPVEDGVVVALSLQGASIIKLIVECPDGRYFGSISAPNIVYPLVVDFLRRNHGRKLREIMDAEIDLSAMVH